jgi:hypothetical protein
MNTSLQAVAASYITGDPSMMTPAEQRAFDQWLTASYRPIAHLVQVTGAEVSPETIVAHWQLKGRLLISSAHSEHPFFSVDTNVKLRAVHDWHHLLVNRGFGWDGEVAACQYALQTAPKAIHWILRSEIMGQAAVAIATGNFPTQKLVRTVGV